MVWQVNAENKKETDEEEKETNEDDEVDLDPKCTKA